MFRSLHMKLVLIMLLLITSLMAIVGAFLMTSVTGFYIDEFYQQMESVFGDSSSTSGAHAWASLSAFCAAWSWFHASMYSSRAVLKATSRRWAYSLYLLIVNPSRYSHSAHYKAPGPRRL